VHHPELWPRVEVGFRLMVEPLDSACGIGLAFVCEFCMASQELRIRFGGEEGWVFPDLVADGGDVRQINEHHDRHQRQGYLSGARPHVQHHAAAFSRCLPSVWTKCNKRDELVFTFAMFSAELVSRVQRYSLL